MIYAMTYVMCAAIMRDKRKYDETRRKREQAIKAYKEKQQSNDD